MNDDKSRRGISRSALTLGSAVAIVGLTAAIPAHAATGGMCCGAKTSKSSSSSNSSSSSGMSNGQKSSMSKSKSGMCSSK